MNLELRHRLYKEFPEIEVDIKFADALCADAWGKEEFDLGETWKTWREIPQDVLEEGAQSSVCFMAKDELVMILPRFLEEMLKPFSTNNITVALDSIEESLKTWINSGVIKLIFHPSQVQLIKNILILYCKGDIKPRGTCFSYDDWTAESKTDKIKTWIDFDIEKGGVWTNPNIVINLNDDKSIDLIKLAEFIERAWPFKTVNKIVDYDFSFEFTVETLGISSSYFYDKQGVISRLNTKNAASDFYQLQNFAELNKILNID